MPVTPLFSLSPGDLQVQGPQLSFLTPWVSQRKGKEKERNKKEEKGFILQSE